jgi:enoyl-CoA hydratase/carnithine racemase
MFPMMVLALLYRHVGRKAATEMLFLGDRISAAEAMHLGILNRVYRRDEFEAGAREFIQKLAEKSSKILRLGKGAILHVEERSLRADIEYLETELAKVMSTEDSREGMRAFLEKRKPVWRDR